MNYQELLLLRAARTTGVLEAFSTPATPTEVADRTGVTERAARITAQALADMGFLDGTADGDGFEPTDRTTAFTTDDLEEMGGLPFQLDCLERWIDLPETMRTGAPADPSTDRTEHYTAAMATVEESTVRACVTAAVHEHPDAGRVLDVGGGPGRFATEFARRGHDVTVFERPAVVDLVGTVTGDVSVDLVAGDARESLTGAGTFDLVFCSRVLQAFSPAENRRVLANAREVLAPGGTVVLVELVRGRSSAAPLFGAHMLAQTEGGNTYTADQYAEWFADAGLDGFRVEDVPDTNYQTVAGDRPE